MQTQYRQKKLNSSDQMSYLYLKSSNSNHIAFIKRCLIALQLLCIDKTKL